MPWPSRLIRADCPAEANVRTMATATMVIGIHNSAWASFRLTMLNSRTGPPPGTNRPLTAGSSRPSSTADRAPATPAQIMAVTSASLFRDR